jgi:hypothetical protein
MYIVVCKLYRTNYKKAEKFVILKICRTITTLRR